MSLTTGQTLSFYEILDSLGAGGMGEVYRAVDTRLEREVAIKVLPEEMAGDEERLRRFEREAKTLASLNHPNIARDLWPRPEVRRAQPRSSWSLSTGRRPRGAD